MKEILQFLADNSVVISVVSATIALGSCLSSLLGFRLQTKSIDFNNCLEVVKQLAEAQRRIRDAASNETRDFEIVELLNLMEALALLVNRGRIARSAAEYTGHFLEEAWASLKANDDVLPLVEKSISGADTYSELLKFASGRHKRITALVKAYRALPATA